MVATWNPAGNMMAYWCCRQQAYWEAHSMWMVLIFPWLLCSPLEQLPWFTSSMPTGGSFYFLACLFKMKAIICYFLAFCLNLSAIVCNYMLKSWLCKGSATKLCFRVKFGCSSQSFTQMLTSLILVTCLVIDLEDKTQKLLMHRKESLIVLGSSLLHFSNFELSLTTLSPFVWIRSI